MGPRALPGRYRVRLEADGTKLEQELVIEKDPRVAVTDAELAEQFDLHMRIRDKLSEVHQAINDIREARERGHGDGRLATLEGRLIQRRRGATGRWAATRR